MIAVIDYGLGNLRSVSKALESVGADVKVTDSPEEIAKARAIVFPGVGAFQRGMENLEKLDILSPLLEAIKKGKPFLGICLGLQLLFTESEEHGLQSGLDIIKGKVKKFDFSNKQYAISDTRLKVPHMGWNRVKQVTSHKSQVTGKNLKPEACSLQLFNGIPDNSYFYFVHTYYVEPEDKEAVVATAEYGKAFVSVVNKDNVWGVQFHPEKSAKLGLKFLENFCRYVS